MPYTVRIYTVSDQTAWNDYTFDDSIEAFHSLKGYGYVPGEVVPADLSDPSIPGHEWTCGFKIYDQDGVCFHSHDGTEIGATIT